MFTKFMQYIYSLISIYIDCIYSWFIIITRNRKAEMEISFRNFALQFLLLASSDPTIKLMHILMHIRYGQMHIP